MGEDVPTITELLATCKGGLGRGKDTRRGPFDFRGGGGGGMEKFLFKKSCSTVKQGNRSYSISSISCTACRLEKYICLDSVSEEKVLV